jgi:hypothetical protein
MHESRWIFLVCTPEVASLHLARESSSTCSEWIWLTVYGCFSTAIQKGPPILPSEVEQVVGAPVMMTFPNDYARVANAITNGSTVDPKSQSWESHTTTRGPHGYNGKALKHAEPTPSIRGLLQYFARTI